MKKFYHRAKNVLSNERGASNMEIIIWVSIVLVIATALFMFRDQITNFLNRAGEQVDGLEVE